MKIKLIKTSVNVYVFYKDDQTQSYSNVTNLDKELSKMNFIFYSFTVEKS